MHFQYNNLQERFRKFFPVVIDIETAGFNKKINALLEIAVITLKMDKNGWIKKSKTIHYHITPFSGSLIEIKSLLFNKIDPFNPLRQAVSEHEALTFIFDIINQEMQSNKCKKSILVAHNPQFDYSFIKEAIKRCNIKNNPFHQFVTFDTATLSGFAVGETVLSKACKIMGLCFDNKKAHSALYDAIQTANLFCKLINLWKKLGKWPIKKNKFINK
ncbi:ribonuclease T [Buchnera aphidicola]|uniref:ribonuclease T n=1 Tax=Buchnera aphidicola TaxID=9 RepID=UPI0031B83D33